MRILFLADRLSGRGGADVHLLGVLAQLVRRGHRVTLAVGRSDGSASAPCVIHQVAGLDARDARPAELAPLYGEVRPDLVHVHNVVNPAVLRAAADAGPPAVATVQDHRAFCPGRGKLRRDGGPCHTPMSSYTCADCFDDEDYARRMVELTRERLAALRGLELIVLSRYMRDELIAMGLPSGRLHVIPPFVHDLPAGTRTERRSCVAFVGRLVEAKGVFDAARAWERAGVGLPLVFAGTGSARGQLEAQGHRVTGWLDRAALATLYRTAAAVVLPSRWQEPFGIVGLEALAQRTPVAAWRSGGVEEWHPGGELLAPWGDVEALSAALSAAMGWEAATPPAGFGPKPAMDRLETLYERIWAPVVSTGDVG